MRVHFRYGLPVCGNESRPIRFHTQYSCIFILCQFQIRTSIDIKGILRKSIQNQKLVVTLPWVVQLISMLDQVSLHSDYYRDIFNIFYELYIMMNDSTMNAVAKLRPTSVFIIRSCLGWLFDQLNLSNDYYLYRQNRKSLDALLGTAPASINTDMMAVRIFVPKSMASFFSEDHQIHLNANHSQEHPNKLVATLEICGNNNVEQSMPSFAVNENRALDIGSDLTVFDPLLESVLPAACPFLADFRVSIMPKYNSKAVSRTGRYRHYTPRNFTSSTTTTTTTAAGSSTTTTTAKPSTSNNADDMQAKLAEAFLRSQSLSVRRVVEFVEERVFSAVCKDFHMEVLVPFKRSIIASIDAIELRDSNAIHEEICRIYANGEKTLNEKWLEFVAPAALERVKVRNECKYITLGKIKRTRSTVGIINCIRSV